jgi:hypothetical protein
MNDYCELPYPFKVKASAKFLEELYQCEHGRYEDACNAREKDSNEDIIANGYNWVYCDFGDRFKTQLEIHCEQELEEVLYVLSSSTINLFMPRAAERLYDELTRIILGKPPRETKPKPTKAHKEARTEFQNKVQKCVDKCIRFLIKENKVRNPKLFKKRFEVKTKKIRSCWGGLGHKGQPQITVRTGYMEKTGNFKEYDRIADNDFIGSFYSEKNADHIMAIVCHEIAHAVDHWNGVYSSHGKPWQKIYKTLRTRFKLVGMPRPKYK